GDGGVNVDGAFHDHREDDISFKGLDAAPDGEDEAGGGAGLGGAGEDGGDDAGDGRADGGDDFGNAGEESEGDGHFQADDGVADHGGGEDDGHAGEGADGPGAVFGFEVVHGALEVGADSRRENAQQGADQAVGGFA